MTNSKKVALLSGICGQDGSYLADILLERGYEVHGIVRRSSRGYGALENIEHLFRNDEIYRKRLFLHSGDLMDATSLFRIVGEVQPDIFLNMAAQADVQESFFMPTYTIEVNGNGVINCLEAIRRCSPATRFLQASTSELFGDTKAEPQNEDTPMNPQSPYAIGKYVGYQAVKKYRESHGLFAVNAISFNHASPRRTSDYLDRKVTLAVARIKLGKQKELRLGNLKSRRDWSYAKDIVEGMLRIIDYEKPEDFVLGTGISCEVSEWVELVFDLANLEMEEHVVIDKKLFRPAEVDNLRADPSKAERLLGWKASTSWQQLCRTMVEADLEREKV